MNDWRDGLSPEQREAVEHSGGPLIVLSGPGTGKTRVIVHRIARLIAQGEDPGRIVAMTYTTKAAREMRDRLAGLVGSSRAELVHAQTFHSFGQRLVRRFGDLLGLPAKTLIADSAMEKRLLRSLAREHGLFRAAAPGGLDAALARARKWIEQMGHHAVFPDQARKAAESMRDRARTLDTDGGRALAARAEEIAEVASLAECFTEAKRRKGWLSFEDLITLPISLLALTNTFVADICRSDYRRFIVDEFQDINPAQLRLIELLSPAADADVCAVGDDDQAIYAFRGSDDRVFESFSRAWPRRHVVVLTENHRSVPAVVAVGNSVISRASHRFAPDKVVRPFPSNTHEPWAGVEIVRHSGDLDGALVAATLLVDRHQHPSKPWSGYAILAQKNSDLEAAASALEIEGIPTVRQRSASIADDQGVQDTLAWARLLGDPQDGYAACRLMARPPYSINPDDVAGWIRRYRAVQTQAANRHEVSPPFAAWLASLHDDRLTGFLDRHAELAALAATEPAGEVVYQIVLRTDPAHADLPCDADGRARARRVAALVALLRFARERQDRLEQPGRLREFLDYYDDLDDKDRSLGSDEDRIDGDAEIAPETDGVRLLTAHSSKGLEFDTVLVLRVHPSGFPSSRRHEDAPPDELLGLHHDDSRHADEQRRLFYVACTRTKQRLVLFAKTVKKATGTHYTVELESDHSVSESASVRTAAEVMDRAAELGITLRSQNLATGAGRPRSEAEFLAMARADARRVASLALERSGTESLDEEEFAECARGLSDAAARLAIVHAVEHGRPPAPWLLASKDRRVFHDTLAADVVSSRGATSFGLRAPPPPLSLSFSSITDFEKCPRCWYFKHVLELPEPPSDRANIGSLVHTVLERWGKLRQRAAASGSPEPSSELLLALVRTAAEERRGLDDDISPETIDQVRTLIARAVGLDDPRANLLDLEHVIRFPYVCEGISHTMTAKIDRIDQLNNDLRVIDYKTGEPRKYLRSPAKDDPQLGIYAMALAWRFAGTADKAAGDFPIPMGLAEYWILSTGERGTIAFDDLDLPKVRKKIDGVIERILAGDFARSGSCREQQAEGSSPLCAVFGDLVPPAGKGSAVTSTDS